MTRKFHTAEHLDGILQAIIMQYNIIANIFRLVKGFFLFLTDFFISFEFFRSVNIPIPELGICGTLQICSRFLFPTRPQTA